MAVGGGGLLLAGRIHSASHQCVGWQAVHHWAFAGIINPCPCMLAEHLVVGFVAFCSLPKTSSSNACLRRSSRRRAALAGWPRCGRCASGLCLLSSP